MRDPKASMDSLARTISRLSLTIPFAIIVVISPRLREFVGEKTLQFRLSAICWKMELLLLMVHDEKTVAMLTAQANIQIFLRRFIPISHSYTISWILTPIKCRCNRKISLSNSLIFVQYQIGAPFLVSLYSWCLVVPSYYDS